VLICRVSCCGSNSGRGREREGKGGVESASIFLSRTFVKCSIVP
jgi:hypothetical protein